MPTRGSWRCGGIEGLRRRLVLHGNVVVPRYDIAAPNLIEARLVAVSWDHVLNDGFDTTLQRPHPIALASVRHFSRRTSIRDLMVAIMVRPSPHPTVHLR